MQFICQQVYKNHPNSSGKWWGLPLSDFEADLDMNVFAWQRKNLFFHTSRRSIETELTERNVCVGVWVCLYVPKTHNSHCYCSLHTLRLYSVNDLPWKRGVAVYSSSVIRDLFQNLVSCLPREHFRHHKRIPNMFQKRTLVICLIFSIS